jgi:NADH:ubiquinone oxidoreductase subunit C
MMTDYRNDLQSIPGATGFVQQRDGWWMAAPQLDVQALAHCMKDWGARFSTITGAMLPGGETEVIYHYCLDCQAYNFKVATTGNSLPSISPILPAAEWIEREIQDLYQVTFTGHPHPDRLLRPLQLEPGFFRERGGAASKGRSA